MTETTLSSTVGGSSVSSSEEDSNSRQATSTAPTSEEIIEMLGNLRRRYVVHYLLQEGGNASLRELSEQVAAWEHGIAPNLVSYDQRRNVYTALKQHHLPRMEDAEMLNYDEARSSLELTAAMEDCDICLDVVKRGRTIPWSEYYLGLGIVLTALIGLAWIELPPFRYLPPLALAGTIAVIVIISGAVHLYCSRQARLGAGGRPPEL